jgi:hypothetical protein
MTVEEGDDEIIPDVEMNLRKVQSFLIVELEHLSTRPEWHLYCHHMSATDLILIPSSLEHWRQDFKLLLLWTSPVTVAEHQISPQNGNRDV